ncbi:MAG: thiolase domain-containing protein [Candidatus Caldarchaeales archaeon]
MRRVAIVGAGMTDFRSMIPLTSPEMIRLAVKRCLDDVGGLSIRHVDGVLATSAPDAFDGYHDKGAIAVEAAGAIGKPITRVFVGGGSGVAAGVAGWYHVASGAFDTLLVVAWEKMSHPYPHAQKLFQTIFDPVLEKPLGPNLIWIFALEMMRYMEAHGLKKELIAEVAVKNKRNALDHPHAQLGARITVDDVLNSEVLVWPVNRLDISPTSDGAVALLLASEEVAKKLTDNPVWIEGVATCLDSQFWTSRDLAYPYYVYLAAQTAYRMAKIASPLKEVDVWEPYDPFTYKELHHMDGLLGRPGLAPKLLAEGQMERDGDCPTSPSGGLLGVGNPIAAAGLMKVAELYYQLSGRAGKRQVPDAEVGVAQAWGDLMQVGTVVVCRR